MVEDFDRWQRGVHPSIQREPVWRFLGYRKALYLYECIWSDTASWMNNRGKSLAWQIIKSSSSISANLEEGYGRGYGNDLLYFYRVALASARETKGWIYRGKSFYSGDELTMRLSLCDEVISLLVREISVQKARTASKR